jgi:hypothetical protein
MADERPTPIEPPVLDRAGLERVLARAAELQSAVGDAPEALSEEQLLDVGREVGIAPEHLRQAIAEERGRGLLPPESGLAVLFAGASTVAAARVVPGTPVSVLAALDATMQRDEVLVLKRRFPERLIWEAQRGFIGGLRRGFALSGRSYHLESASDVAAGVAAVDAGRVHVRLNVTFHELRGRRLGVAMTGAGLLALAGVAAAAMGVMPLVAAAVPAAIAIAAFAITRREYRRSLARAQVALEQILDRLEYGAPRPSPAQSLLDAFIGPPRLPK